MAFTRNSALEAVFLGVALFLLFLTGLFAAMSANNLKKNPALGRDPTLTKARNYLVWAAVVAFIGFFLVLLMLILFFVFREKAASWKVISLILSVITLILALVAGVLAALGASDMKKSRNYTGIGSDNAANTEAIVASVVSLAGIGILLIVYIIYKLFIQTKAGEAYIPDIPGRSPSEVTIEANVKGDKGKAKKEVTIKSEGRPAVDVQPLPKRTTAAPVVVAAAPVAAAPVVVAGAPATRFIPQANIGADAPVIVVP
jgi:hypothetical protein